MPGLKAAIVPVTPFQQNCSILWDEASMRGAVIDPGGEVERIGEALAKLGVTVEKILLTHGHIDHAGGAARLAEMLGVPIEGPHRKDEFLLEKLAETGLQYGVQDARPVVPDRWLEEGDTVTVGALTFAVIECPGHTPGSVVLFNADNRFCFMGDVLFQGSVGRTDFPYGDHDALISAIRTKLFPLGDDVAFLPGHGGPSTIGDERRNNPFLST